MATTSRNARAESVAELVGQAAQQGVQRDVVEQITRGEHGTPAGLCSPSVESVAVDHRGAEEDPAGTMRYRLK